MRDLNLLIQAWPNAVFGLRPRLFFLLIPYIHNFVLHRRFYQLNITFNFDLTPYIEGDDAAAC